MFLNYPKPSTGEESLKDVFAQGMKLFNEVEDGLEATNVLPVQMTIKAAISKFEKATNMVSISGMFSKNESFEELPTETLKYLLLPAYLGILTLKLCDPPRKELIHVAEIYFRDFIQRCKDYGVTDVEVPQNIRKSPSPPPKHKNDLDKIDSMVKARDEKIKKYREMKETKDKLLKLSKSMNSPNVDDEVKRKYYATLLSTYVNQSLEELNSIELEKPFIAYMELHIAKPKNPIDDWSGPRPLKPVIITRDAVQKAVFGAGYPAIPTLSIEEFYDKRVKEGIFPGGSGTNKPHTTSKNTKTDGDEADKIRKEKLVEKDDPEWLERQRRFDEYKDEHKRGSGNRHNRS